VAPVGGGRRLPGLGGDERGELFGGGGAHAGGGVVVLVELGLVEQRYAAVLEVLDGA